MECLVLEIESALVTVVIMGFVVEAKTISFFSLDTKIKADRPAIKNIIINEAANLFISLRFISSLGFYW